MKKLELGIDKDWIKQHWWLITAASTIYLYTVAFVSTLIFYDAFDLSVFSFFELSDYLRILFRDVGMFGYPFFIVLIVLALSILRKKEKKISEQEGTEYSSSLFLQVMPIVVLALSFIFPIHTATFQAELIKNGAYQEVNIKLKGKNLSAVTIIGGTSEFVFIYGPPSNKAQAINKSEVIDINFIGPNKALLELKKEREEKHRESRSG